MTRGSETTGTQAVQSAADTKDEPAVEFGENLTIQRPMPTRRADTDFSRDATDVFAVGQGQTQTSEPTPETYVNENPTVPPFVKRSKFTVKVLERNPIMRYVGTIGPYYGDKYRTWIMSCSAFLTLSCMMLLVVPFIALTQDPDLLMPFSWGKGKAHWKLLAPNDWTTEMYLGLGGMTNKTQRGDTYYVKYTSVECTEVFKQMCTDCNSASITILIFLCLSMACVVPAFFLDVHRIFRYFDLNFSKMAALWLHLVFGLIFAILAYITWTGKCFSGLPSEAVNYGVGRKGIGMYLTWEPSTSAYVMLAIVIIRPFPGLLTLLVPTPSWANNKGLKAARARQTKQQKQVMDPFDDIARGVTRAGRVIDPDEKDDLGKPPQLAYADPGQDEATVVAQVVRGEPALQGRRPSDSASQASGDSAKDYGDLVGMATAVGAPQTIPAPPAPDDPKTIPAQAEGQPALTGMPSAMKPSLIPKKSKSSQD